MEHLGLIPITGNTILFFWGLLQMESLDLGVNSDVPGLHWVHNPISLANDPSKGYVARCDD